MALGQGGKAQLSAAQALLPTLLVFPPPHLSYLLGI